MSTPTTFRAGDSVSWSESLPDHRPADGWSLKYRLLWSTGNATFNATASGDEHSVSLTSIDTANWSPGSATLVRWVEFSGAKLTLSSEQVTILPNLSAAEHHDGRTRNKRALDDAEAALAAYLAGGKAHVAEYSIAGRTMKFRSAEDIVAIINHYRPLVARENTALALLQCGSVPGRVYYRG